MAFPVTLNGTTYTLSNFEGLNYVDGFPDALEDFVTEAATKVTAAQTAQTAAETAQAAAEAALDSFDDRFLGTKASDPTLDNDGNALTDGALYFDTTNNVMKVYDLGGTQWLQTTPTSAEQTNIDTVAGISSNVTTVAGISANVTTVATNITDVNSFANLYRIASTEPSTNNDEGDLYFNTTSNTMRVYNGTSFQDVAPLATSVTVSQVSDLTATAAELNTLDGITATVGELNILDGVTADATELNYLDITTLGLSQASKAVTADANGVVTFDNGVSEEVTSITSSSGAATLNLRDGTNFEHDLTENVTYTFSNPASSGKMSAFTLKVIQGATARTITWPASVDWPGATAPTLSTDNDAVDVFVFFTIDGGTTYYGFTAGQALG